MPHGRHIYAKAYDSQILIHSCTSKKDGSLDKEFQKNMSKYDRKHGLIDQGKYRKISIKLY